MNYKMPILIAVMMAFTAVAQAQQANATEEKTKVELPPIFQKHKEAQRLANEGQQKKSAALLIKAAQIIVDNPYSDLSVQKEVKPNELDGKKVSDKKQVDGNTAIAQLNVTELLKEARKYAKKDAKLLKEIAALEAVDAKNKATIAVAHRGTLNGPFRRYDRVNPYSSDYYNYTFRGESRAVVAVSGDGDTDLDVYVYDQYGNLVASDTDNGDDCYVSWTPRWTGTFRIKVVNRGSVYNNYVIGTN